MQFLRAQLRNSKVEATNPTEHADDGHFASLTNTSWKWSMIHWSKTEINDTTEPFPPGIQTCYGKPLGPHSLVSRKSIPPVILPKGQTWWKNYSDKTNNDNIPVTANTIFHGVLTYTLHTPAWRMFQAYAQNLSSPSCMQGNAGFGCQGPQGGFRSKK